MASFSTNTISPDAFIAACTKFYKFRTPLCKPTVDYELCFKSSIAQEAAATLVRSINSSRKHMIITVYGSGTTEEKLQSIGSYIPHLFHLLHSLNQQESFKTDQDLRFEWRGALINRADYYKSTDLILEVMMVLHFKAILYHQKAAELMDSSSSSTTSFLPEAGKHLLTASGIMDYLAQNIINGRWNKAFSSKQPNPPEVSANVCLALAALFKAEAQALSVMMALSNGASKPPMIKAKLSVGVVNTLQLARQRMAAAENAEDAIPDLFEHICIKIQLFTSVAYQYAACAHIDKAETGMAIACCNAAKAAIVEDKVTVWKFKTSNCLPKFTGQFQYLSLAVAYLSTDINARLRKAEQENNAVYFQTIPTAAKLPDEACIMVPVVFVEPVLSEYPQATFEYKPKPSVLGSLFTGWGSKKKSTGDLQPVESLDRTATYSANDTDSTSIVDGSVTEVGTAAIEPTSYPVPVAYPASSTQNTTTTNTSVSAEQLRKDAEYARSLQQQEVKYSSPGLHISNANANSNNSLI